MTERPEKKSVRKSIFLTPKTQKELDELIEAYGENSSRVISRLINAEYVIFKSQDKTT